MGSAARIEPAGQTVDMLRNRADMADPKENKKLYALIEQRGAIITDLLLGFRTPREKRGGCGSRGRAVFWFADPRAAGDGAWPRGVWRVGQRDPTPALGAESIDPYGGKARDDPGRNCRRAAHLDSPRALSGGDNHGQETRVPL
jgi:hypothetical protein